MLRNGPFWAWEWAVLDVSWGCFGHVLSSIGAVLVCVGCFGFSEPFSTFIWAVLAMGRFGIGSLILLTDKPSETFLIDQDKNMTSLIDLAIMKVMMVVMMMKVNTDQQLGVLCWWFLFIFDLFDFIIDTLHMSHVTVSTTDMSALAEHIWWTTLG